MKKTAVILVALLALSVTLMAVAPALAKPYTVTVIVKDKNGDIADGVWVVASGQYSAGGAFNLQPAGQATNSHGKATFTVPSDFEALRSGYSALAYYSSAFGTVIGSTTFSVSSKFAARVTLTLTVAWPPP